MKFYKISEVAKTFGISRETLIYYDTIGLFKPAYTDETNGYRYYTNENISDLYFIMMLKKANFSLKEIKNYMNAKTSEESLNILNEKLKHIEKQMEILKNSAEILNEKIEEIERISNSEGCTPYIEIVNELDVYSVKIDEPKTDKELVEGIRELNAFRKKYGLDHGERVSILKIEDIEKKEYFRIDKIGVIVDSNFKFKNFKLQREKVVSIYHKDATPKIGESYEKLKNFIKENNLEICGNSRERFKDVIVNSGNCTGQTIKISIPVK